MARKTTEKPTDAPRPRSLKTAPKPPPRPEATLSSSDRLKNWWADPANRERAPGAEQRSKDRIEQLDLAHEEELLLRPQRQPQRPGVDVGEVIRREHVAAGFGEVLLPARPEPVEQPDRRGREGSEDEVEGGNHQALNGVRPNTGTISVRQPA